MLKEINRSHGIIVATVYGAVFMLAVVVITSGMVLAFKWCLGVGSC